ncbi:hypothetical protein E5D57_000054 [Metarhizium anisopliae]|nr:hypothetical protein E5D57_000054 [Metarhizium anisopliae]
MTSTILGVSVAVVVTWVLAYVVDLAGVLPDPDEDMIRDVVLKPHLKRRDVGPRPPSKTANAHS